MAFTQPALSLASIRLEQATRVTVTNDAAPADVYVVINGHMRKMDDDPNVANGFLYNIYGWMVGQCSLADVLVIGTNGDTRTRSAALTVTAPRAPFLPVIQFLLDYLSNEATIGPYAKVFKGRRTPGEFITTRPRFEVLVPGAEVPFTHIGDPEVSYETDLQIVFLDDYRRRTMAGSGAAQRLEREDYERHEAFIRIVVDYLRNNPNLDSNLGVIDIDIVDVKMPDERATSVYLHQSSVNCKMKIIPEYA